jgi:hypothetical protein
MLDERKDKRTYQLGREEIVMKGKGRPNSQRAAQKHISGDSVSTVSTLLRKQAMEKKKAAIRTAAMDLITDPRFFSRLVRKLNEMGLVGEARSALIIFLACLTKNLPKQVSVLLKGESSTGKSNLLRTVTALFPEDSVIKLSSLSAKALAHGEGTLQGKILYLHEYRGGKDAMYLTRLQQSEGEIAHEYTTVSGRTRGTTVARREGTPVVLTTTTARTVFSDDETRFLSVGADESETLTRQVVRHELIRTSGKEIEPSEDVWKEATRLITKQPPTFRRPKWFEFVAEQIPADEPRARRDVGRFCSLLEAIALCRSFTDGRREECGELLEIDFADYCVAHEILNDSFSSTYRSTNSQALRIAETVRDLHSNLERGITTREMADATGWKLPVTYKWLKAAERDKFVVLEPGTNERNLKRYSPGEVREIRFLPHPEEVLSGCPDIEESGGYLDPLTEKWKKVQRRTTHRSHPAVRGKRTAMSAPRHSKRQKVKGGRE